MGRIYAWDGPEEGFRPLRVNSGGEGVVEKPGPGSERVPLVLHGHRIDFTLSSRRRSNATEKGLLKKS